MRDAYFRYSRYLVFRNEAAKEFINNSKQVVNSVLTTFDKHSYKMKFFLIRYEKFHQIITLDLILVLYCFSIAQICDKYFLERLERVVLSIKINLGDFKQQ